MIIKNYEIKNFINKKNIFLIYGFNEGLKEEIITNFLQGYSKENTFKYNEKDILIDLENFYNELYSQSFFNKNKIILINNATDKIKNEIEIILKKDISDILLVLISNNLEKKSKLRSLFEKDNKLICVPVYKDDNKTLLNIAFSFFKSKKISISTECLNLIVERSSEDRKNLKSEMIKIENFVGSKKKINLEELTELTNLTENYSINKVVDMSLAKNTRQTLRALNENIFTTEEVITIIRSFLIKAKRLLKLNNELKKNKSIDQVIASTRPPIFWKDKALVKKQMQNWKKKNIETLIENINDTELLLKKNNNSAINILQNFIIEQTLKVNN